MSIYTVQEDFNSCILDLNRLERALRDIKNKDERKKSHMKEKIKKLKHKAEDLRSAITRLDGRLLSEDSEDESDSDYEEKTELSDLVNRELETIGEGIQRAKRECRRMNSTVINKSGNELAEIIREFSVKAEKLMEDADDMRRRVDNLNNDTGLNNNELNNKVQNLEKEVKKLTSIKKECIRNAEKKEEEKLKKQREETELKIQRLQEEEKKRDQEAQNKHELEKLEKKHELQLHEERMENERRRHEQQLADKKHEAELARQREYEVERQRIEAERRHESQMMDKQNEARLAEFRERAAQKNCELQSAERQHQLDLKNQLEYNLECQRQQTREMAMIHMMNEQSRANQNASETAFLRQQVISSNTRIQELEDRRSNNGIFDLFGAIAGAAIPGGGLLRLAGTTAQHALPPPPPR
ncbi:hypothetical protein FO519_008888 [Halicephalobus sp. NKZ332]|nr:hypothetical protein FO519_008888 [Halicephalobus sp. NKZ332]